MSHPINRMVRHAEKRAERREALRRLANAAPLLCVGFLVFAANAVLFLGALNSSLSA